MRTYRPKSYSEQARILADNFLVWEDTEEALKALFDSYRHPIVRYRACKRFGRKCRN